MSSYLEAYGAAEQHRARILGIIKTSSIVLGCVLVAGLILYGVFKNHSEERPRQNFLRVADRAQLSSRLCHVGLHGVASLPRVPVREVSRGLGTEERARQ